MPELRARRNGDRKFGLQLPQKAIGICSNHLFIDPEQAEFVYQALYAWKIMCFNIHFKYFPSREWSALFVVFRFYMFTFKVRFFVPVPDYY